MFSFLCNVVCFIMVLAYLLKQMNKIFLLLLWMEFVTNVQSQTRKCTINQSDLCSASSTIGCFLCLGEC